MNSAACNSCAALSAQSGATILAAQQLAPDGSTQSGRTFPVNGPAAVGVNLHEKLRHLRLRQALAQVRPQLFKKMAGVQLPAPILIRLLCGGPGG